MSKIVEVSTTFGEIREGIKFMCDGMLYVKAADYTRLGSTEVFNAHEAWDFYGRKFADATQIVAWMTRELIAKILYEKTDEFKEKYRKAQEAVLAYRQQERSMLNQGDCLLITGEKWRDDEGIDRGNQGSI